jgi:hypothetical protein
MFDVINERGEFNVRHLGFIAGEEGFSASWSV